ncbi:recombinase [Pasteurellaceae bacterium 15-036681]|nr:recombinase [Pasteurellaceae bacterium 15-036681]
MNSHYQLTEKSVSIFINEQLEKNDMFTLLNTFCEWLRENKSSSENLRTVIKALEENQDLTRNLSSQLCRWLCSMRLYPLLISNGMLAREGFGREFRSRLYEKINPSFKDISDLRDIFVLLFKDKDDVNWLNNVSISDWQKLLKLLADNTTAHEHETLRNHLYFEGLFAIEMLSIWIAAEDMDPDLMRLDPTLLDVNSPFVELQREVALWVNARRKHQAFDSSHLDVMFIQSRELIERLRKKGISNGASLGVAHLLERLEQTLSRLSALMKAFGPNRFLARRMLLLTHKLAIASADKHSVVKLWRQSVGMLSRTITQSASDHGEHYITRSRKEYLSMFYSAAGAGVIIAFMALIKVYLGELIENRFWFGLVAGINYAVGFIIIFLLHFTVATKQPAMTAARFAEAVERNSQGRSIDMQLAQLLVDVLRSQTAAVLGNLSLALIVSALIGSIYQSYLGNTVLDSNQIEYQLNSINPLNGALWFAAIAGVWLFCSGIIAGFFDNRCNYLNLRMRLQEHPLLTKIMPAKLRERFANYIHNNYGAIMGNASFGLLLGLTGVVGYVTGLPLDIRHIAFSSANIGYVMTSGEISLLIFIQSLFFVILIGLVNLIVSFSLTLFIALRSLNKEIHSWKNIAHCVWDIAKQKPLSLFFPIDLDDKDAYQN